jgi:hypothetical protein
MPDRSTSRLLAFSVDKAAIEQLEGIFREARAQIEEQVRELHDQTYRDRLAAIPAHYTDKYRQNYVGRLEKLRDDRINTQLRETDTTYTISTSDAIKGIKLVSINELLAYPNWKNQSITALSLEAGSYNTLNLSVSLDAYDFKNSVTYQISGDLRSIEHYSRKLDQWVFSIRRWYSIFYLLSFLVVLLFTVLTVCAIYMEVAMLGYVEQQWQIIIVVAMNVLLLILLLWATHIVFPLGEFAIGDGINRKRRRDSLAKFIAGPIALAIVIGIISGVIANKVSK